MLAEMAREVAAARAVTREAARAKDRGEALAEVSSIAKWTASDTAMRVATDSVQLFGASGYSSGLILGGLLTSFGWRWTFLIPAPLAVALGIP